VSDLPDQCPRRHGWVRRGGVVRVLPGRAVLPAPAQVRALQSVGAHDSLHALAPDRLDVGGIADRADPAPHRGQRPIELGALSKLSPVLPVEGATPASTRRWVNRSAVYCAPLSL
jgi:hypothetical protein